MPHAVKPCSIPGCTELVTTGRCDPHRQEADRLRGNRHQRGYGRTHEQRFRHGVLRRDPLCVCLDRAHNHWPACLAPSTVADHHPHTRRELVALGLDPNDPRYGRGLCKGCHDQHTAATSPGGWNAR